jgi:hypothetical protein
MAVGVGGRLIAVGVGGRVIAVGVGGSSIAVGVGGRTMAVGVGGRAGCRQAASAKAARTVAATTSRIRAFVLARLLVIKVRGASCDRTALPYVLSDWEPCVKVPKCGTRIE